MPVTVDMGDGTVTPHASAACYRKGCRLPECVDAARAYRRAKKREYRERAAAPASSEARSMDREPEGRSSLTAPVGCWCESRIVLVPWAEMRAGVTRSCGAAKCHAPERRVAA